MLSLSAKRGSEKIHFQSWPRWWEPRRRCSLGASSKTHFQFLRLSLSLLLRRTFLQNCQQPVVFMAVHVNLICDTPSFLAQWNRKVGRLERRWSFFRKTAAPRRRDLVWSRHLDSVDWLMTSTLFTCLLLQSLRCVFTSTRPSPHQVLGPSSRSEVSYACNRSVLLWMH